MPAASCKALGFQVAGWSRGAKAMPGSRRLPGPPGSTRCCARSEILVCLLPLTAETAGILNAPAFARLPPGAGSSMPGAAGIWSKTT